MMRYFKVIAKIEGGKGSLNCPGSGIVCKEGTNLKLICKPNDGYKIVCWKVNDIEYSPSNEFNINKIDRNLNVCAMLNEDCINNTSSTNAGSANTKPTIIKSIKRGLQKYFPKLSY